VQISNLDEVDNIFGKLSLRVQQYTIVWLVD